MGYIRGKLAPFSVYEWEFPPLEKFLGDLVSLLHINTRVMLGGMVYLDRIWEDIQLGTAGKYQDV
jgi:hypothetical protein